MLLDKPGGESVFIILSLITAILNVYEIVLIARCKNRKAFDKFLLSLAVSDILVALSVASFKIVDLATCNTIAWLERENFANMFLISAPFSVTNLIAITADRFLAVRFPIQHRILSTKRRVYVAIVITWSLGIVSIAIFCVIQFKWEEKIEITLYIASVYLLAFGVMMIVVYVNIFYLICKRTVPGKTARGKEQVRTRIPALVLKGPNITERGVILTGAIVTISFIICTYPFAFNLLIQQSVGKISMVPKALILLNSLFNPLIYFFKSYYFSRRG